MPRFLSSVWTIPRHVPHGSSLTSLKTESWLPTRGANSTRHTLLVFLLGFLSWVSPKRGSHQAGESGDEVRKIKGVQEGSSGQKM